MKSYAENADWNVLPLSFYCNLLKSYAYETSDDWLVFKNVINVKE